MQQWLNFSMKYSNFQSVYLFLSKPVVMLLADLHLTDLLSLRHHWVGGESQRCWLLVWQRCGGPVQRCQWHPHDLSSTPAGHGGLQVALQWDCAHCVVSTKLLLQVGRCTKYSLNEWASCQHIHRGLFITMTNAAPKMDPIVVGVSYLFCLPCGYLQSGQQPEAIFV